MDNFSEDNEVLDKLCLNLDMARAELFKLLNNSDYKMKKELLLPNENNIRIFPEAQYIEKINTIFIKVFDIPPLKKKDIFSVKSMWIKGIKDSINGLNLDIKYEKAFIYIKYFLPIKSDLDNRCNKYIIDGIRYSRIINDDDFTNVSLAISGEKDTTCPRTEIYVFDVKNTRLFLDFLDKNIG